MESVKTNSMVVAVRHPERNHLALQSDGRDVGRAIAENIRKIEPLGNQNQPKYPINSPRTPTPSNQ